MKLVTFEQNAGLRLGALLLEEQIIDLAAAARILGQWLPDDMQGLIEAGERIWDAARAIVANPPEEAIVSRAAVSLRSPLPRPIRLRDASLFLEHMENGLAKLGRKMPEIFKHTVVYYNADHLHVYGHEDNIRWPKESNHIDYELEWACVIGKTVRDVAPAEARSSIFGYTIFNDWSARDLQLAFMEGNLGPGEGKDFANSLGPCIVTADELRSPYQLSMSARINGEEWSRGTTGSMTHSFEDAVVQLSRSRDIAAGEVIGSGTVLGGCGFEIDRRLSIGDVVELEVEGIGLLRNRVVADA